ncbi:MAG TPA: hypothetical protein VK445_04190 [Dissulfurispiraceae bacterium]|nr:hypothetical protein [Dissulfurispiraceae bacterium]
MKKIVAVVVAIIFALGMVTMAFAASEKCDKCHKGDKAIDKIVADKKLNADNIVNTLRNSPKAGLHKSLTDDDIKAAVAK